MAEPIRHLAEAAGVQLTDGIPAFTWNGMTNETWHLVKNGIQSEVHLLFPGLHPVSVEEAALRFVWTPKRERLWGQLLDMSPALRDEARGAYLVGGGSFFHSDKPDPGDIDALVLLGAGAPQDFQRGRGVVQKLSANEGLEGVHLTPTSTHPNIAYAKERLANELTISQQRHPAGKIEAGGVLIDIGELAAAAERRSR